MARISVIVPVYNVEKYLHRCVDSVLGQRFSDWELILVDDGSPDNCGAICEEYARQDSRITVLHQKNAGLSAARNAAMDYLDAHSQSQWLTFLDSDDWLHPDFLQRLLDAAQEAGSKVSVSGYGETQGEEPAVKEADLVHQLWTPENFYRSRNIDATIACAKLYHRSCFETIRYPLGKIHEDEFVTYRILFQEQQVVFVPAPLYAYFVNPAGITKRPWNPRRLDAWQAYEEQIRFFEDRGQEDMRHYRYRQYIENAYAQLLAAQNASNAAQLKREIAFIKKRLRSIFRRAGKLGYVRFWIDFDMLYACAPLRTRLYRVWLEVKNIGK